MKVLETVPGQEAAMAFLKGAALRPHHAYIFGGPEGSGKSFAARAFAAALLCKNGGCGECRDCRLALSDQHPNEFVIEPEGTHISVATVRSEIWHPAFISAPEHGPKVFIIREADRLQQEAADVLLKVLEEPPADSLFLLMSARAHELSQTIASRCHLVTFAALSESFVAQTLLSEGFPEERALLAARLCGGNLGRARRFIATPEGLSFRDTAALALEIASRGPGGAIDAAEMIEKTSKGHDAWVVAERKEALAPFESEADNHAYRGIIKRINDRYDRRQKRAAADYADWVLMSMSSLLRDRIVASVTADPGLLVNIDITPDTSAAPEQLALCMAAIEEARATLAETANVSARLVMEKALFQLSASAA